MVWVRSLRVTSALKTEALDGAKGMRTGRTFECPAQGVRIWIGGVAGHTRAVLTQKNIEAPGITFVGSADIAAACYKNPNPGTPETEKVPLIA